MKKKSRTTATIPPIIPPIMGPQSVLFLVESTYFDAEAEGEAIEDTAEIRAEPDKVSDDGGRVFVIRERVVVGEGKDLESVVVPEGVFEAKEVAAAEA